MIYPISKSLVLLSILSSVGCQNSQENQGSAEVRRSSPSDAVNHCKVLYAYHPEVQTALGDDTIALDRDQGPDSFALASTQSEALSIESLSSIPDCNNQQISAFIESLSAGGFGATDTYSCGMVTATGVVFGFTGRGSTAQKLMDRGVQVHWAKRICKA